MSADGGNCSDSEVLAGVRRLHAEMDESVEALVARLPGSLACGRGCADCCLDDLTVFPVEADLIRTRAVGLLTTCEPGPRGACAFLAADGSCRIYEVRPYVCRTQGLPLRWLGALESEHRDICPLNEQPLGVSLRDLGEDQCWTLGEFESRLAGMQAASTGFAEELPRVALRSLFDHRD